MELPQVDAVMKSTVSVRDKLKKRREAFGSILSANVETAKAAAENDAKNESDQKQSGSTSDNASSIEEPAEKKLKLSKDHR